jgi:sporulation protein YlmC with PRC-barrel domain
MTRLLHERRHGALAASTARMALRASAAALVGAALALSPASAQQQQQQQPSAQRQATPQQGAQQQGMQPQRPGSQARQQNRTDSTPNRLVIILPDAELSIPVEQRARPVTAEELYQGIRASRLMDQDVYGPNGNQLGEVQEVLVDAAGRVTAIVVEGGGFLGIGDAAFRVPWAEVNLTPGRDGVLVPFTEDRAERYDLFDGPETVLTGTREFRLSELIGDYARLRDGIGYGRVSDVVIGRDGRILGVLVTRGVGWGAGVYGYPFYGYGYGFDPGADYYAIPYGTADAAAGAPRIEYRRFDAGLL